MKEATVWIYEEKKKKGRLPRIEEENSAKKNPSTSLFSALFFTSVLFTFLQKFCSNLPLLSCVFMS
jgi:hypothetical protein